MVFFKVKIQVGIYRFLNRSLGVYDTESRLLHLALNLKLNVKFRLLWTKIHLNTSMLRSSMKSFRQLEMLITAHHHSSGDDSNDGWQIDVPGTDWHLSAPLAGQLSFTYIQSARLTQDDWMLCICGGPLSCNPPRWLLIMVDYTLKSFLLLLTIIM